MKERLPKECVEEDNCEEALDTERGVFVMCSWVMSRGELAPEGFEAAEWQRFDTLCEGLEGVMELPKADALLRIEDLQAETDRISARLRQTALVRESVPTSNPESGKRWNEAKVRNGQSLTSAHRNGCHCGHRPRSPASVLTTAPGPLPPQPSQGLARSPSTSLASRIVLYEVRGHVTHSDIL